ncbi:MAG: YybH family protein [Gammaproteobacteria bacterium]
MKDLKLELKTPDAVEAAYYEAFNHCDKQVMATLWSDGDVVCVHPGSGAIVGHAAVIRSWEHIFLNAQMPEIHISVTKKTVVDGLAVHLLTEAISTGNETSALVFVTNVYQKFDNGWLMIEHHGSVVQRQQQENRLQ